jgi:OmpA-OmpF porin, OOP family
MKSSQIITKVIALIAVLAVPFVTIPAHAAEVKIEGVIVSRDGDNLVVRSAAGNVNLTVNKATEIMQTLGLVGIRYETVTADSLIPGLSIKSEAESSGSQTVAKSIKFHADDLQRAKEIQAALVVPQQEAQALKEKTKQQEQVIAAQQQQIAAQDQKMVAAQAEVDKRFGELADYDVKDEMTVLFDVNSATLSEKAKADLQAAAAKAKTYKAT